MNYTKILQEGTLYDANKKAFDDFIEWGKGYWNQVDESAVKLLKSLKRNLMDTLALQKRQALSLRLMMEEQDKDG